MIAAGKGGEQVKRNLFVIERRSVISCYYGSRISGSKQCFLTETAIWATILFLSGNHAQEIHTCQFFIFFSAILAGPQFVKIGTSCYHGNMM